MMPNDCEKHLDLVKPPPLFSFMAEEWLNAKRPELKPSTITRYKGLLDSFLLPAFGSREITTITRREVEQFSRKLLSHGKTGKNSLAPGTVNSILSVLRSILSYASYAHEISCPDLRSVRVKQTSKPLRVFTRREQDILNRYILEHQTLCNLGILLSLYTGLRIGEVCALQWSNINLEEKCIYVRQTMQRIPSQNDSACKTEVILTTPKSNTSTRTIPLQNMLVSMLRNIEHDGDCFFLTGNAVKFVEPRTLENHFDAAMKACGIEGATFHTCRHTFATRCIELGFDIKSLSEILGHASVKITMDRYVHPSMEFKRENMNRLASLMTESLRVEDIGSKEQVHNKKNKY